MLYLNAQSIFSKIDELCTTANEHKPDLILIMESWCSEEISDALLTVPGYDLQQDLRVDREDTAGGRGGGLLVYTKTGVCICAIDKVVPFNQYCKFTVFDTVVYLVYRPPSGGPDSIAQLTEVVRETREQCLMLGDFNLPEIDWDMGTTAGRSREFLAATEEAMLEQMVNFHTHVRGNKLDLLLTNIPERIINVEDVGRLGHSDHVMILSTVTMADSAPSRKVDQLDWAKANWDEMERDLRGWDWRTEMEGKDGNEAWTKLRDKLLHTVEAHVPTRRQRNHNRPAWLSTEILRAIRKKKRLWQKAKHGDEAELYKEEEKKVRRLIRNAKKKLERKLAEGGSKDGVQKRKFFAYVKQRTKSRPAIGPLKDGGGNLVKDDRQMAGIFNSYFSEVFTRENLDNIPEPNNTHQGESLTKVKVTTKLVRERIRN